MTFANILSLPCELHNKIISHLTPLSRNIIRQTHPHFTYHIQVPSQQHLLQQKKLFADNLDYSPCITCREMKCPECFYFGPPEPDSYADSWFSEWQSLAFGVLERAGCKPAKNVWMLETACVCNDCFLEEAV